MWNALRSWHRVLKGQAAQRRSAACTPRVRLELESLEDRQLLSATAVTGWLPAQSHASTLSHGAAASSTQASLPIIAQANTMLNINAPAQQLVINSPSALQAQTGLTEAQLDALLGVSSINWSTQMVVMVSQGRGAYGAFSPHVDITSLQESGGTLTVNWRLDRPNPNQIFPMYMVLADPAEFVLTQRFNGPVQFQQGATVTQPPPAQDIVVPMAVADAVTAPSSR